MDIRIDHINLTVANLAESMAWYQKVFAFEFKEGDLTNAEEPWAIMGNDDTFIAMYEDPELKNANETKDSPFHRIYHFGLRVSNQEEWEAKIQELGLKIEYDGVYKYPHSLSWYLLDPSGHEIEVSYTGNGPLRFT